MNTLGLEDRHYQTLRRLLRLYLPEAEIWAYGSRARGDHRPERRRRGPNRTLGIRPARDGWPQNVGRCAARRRSHPHSVGPLLRASGGHRDGSDLDLVARNPRDLDEPQPPAFDRLRAALVDSDIPIVVELRDWARVPAAFHGAMARNAVVVQEPRHEPRPQAETPSAQEISP